MNEFQGGVTASDLSPQTYKNTSQAAGIQSTLNSSAIESNVLNQSINTLPSTGTLVVVGANPSTLGVSTNVSNQSPSYIPIALTIAVVSAILAVYFFRNFKISFASENE